jgi:hypothetical protein
VDVASSSATDLSGGLEGVVRCMASGIGIACSLVNARKSTRGRLLLMGGFSLS